MPKETESREKQLKRLREETPIGEIDAHRENQREQESGRNQDGSPLVKPR